MSILDLAVPEHKTVPHLWGNEDGKPGDLGLERFREFDIHGIPRLSVHGEYRPRAKFLEEGQVLSGVAPAVLVDGLNEGQINPVGPG